VTFLFTLLCITVALKFVDCLVFCSQSHIFFFKIH
jgi:hypothetical protein